MSIIVVTMKDISSVFKVSGNEWLLYLLIGSALAYIRSIWVCITSHSNSGFSSEREWFVRSYVLSEIIWSKPETRRHC